MSHHTVYPTPPSTERSPGSSVAKRRRLNVSEETSSSGSSGSTLIDTTSMFRVGAPAPLPPLPLNITYPHERSQIVLAFKRIEPEIAQILQRLGIGSDAGPLAIGCRLVYRHEVGMNPNQSDLTVFIQTNYHQQWASAVDAIWELLGQHNLQNLRIEIIDWRANQNYYYLTPTPARKQAWQKLSADILKLLGTGREWESLQFVRRGFNEANSAPTILIAVTRIASRDWQHSIYGSVRDMLDAYPSFEVGFIRASGIFANSITAPGERLGSVDFGGKVPVGHSIGYGDGSGTLGGYLQVKDDKGSPKWYGLTNHHVVQNPTTTPEEALLGYEKSFRNGPFIESPSSYDQRTCLKRTQENANIRRDLLEGKPRDPLNPNSPRDGGLLPQLEVWGGFEFAPNNLRGSITSNRNQLNLYENEARKIQSADLRFGTIYASSGREGTLREKVKIQDEKGNVGELPWGMGWALISVLPARLGDNAMPSNPIFSFDNGFTPETNAIVSARKVFPEEGTIVYKRGRNGSSKGQISGFKSWFNSSINKKVYSARAAGPGQGGFSFSGDSGSWVLDQEGKLVGLIFAGNEAGWGCLIPIEKVYDDIRAKTGCEVVSPKLE